MLNFHCSFNWTFVEVEYAVGLSGFPCLSLQYIENSVCKFWALSLCYKHTAGQAQPQDLCLRCIFLRSSKSSNLLLKQKIKILASMVSEFSSMQKWLTECRKNWGTNRKQKDYKKNASDLITWPEQDQLSCVYWKEINGVLPCFLTLVACTKKAPGLDIGWWNFKEN